MNNRALLAQALIVFTVGSLPAMQVKVKPCFNTVLPLEIRKTIFCAFLDEPSLHAYDLKQEVALVCKEFHEWYKDSLIGDLRLCVKGTRYGHEVFARLLLLMGYDNQLPAFFFENRSVRDYLLKELRPKVFNNQVPSSLTQEERAEIAAEITLLKQYPSREAICSHLVKEAFMAMLSKEIQQKDKDAFRKLLKKPFATRFLCTVLTHYYCPTTLLDKLLTQVHTEELIQCQQAWNAGKELWKLGILGSWDEVKEILVTLESDPLRYYALNVNYPYACDRIDDYAQIPLLILAIIKQRSDIVALLLKLGANVNGINFGPSAFMVALSGFTFKCENDLHTTFSIIQSIIDAGASFTYSTNKPFCFFLPTHLETIFRPYWHSMGPTPLAVAIRTGHSQKTIEIFLNEGADLSVENETGSALVAAVKAGSLEMLSLLLEAGAVVNNQMSYSDGDTPLSTLVHVAVLADCDSNAHLRNLSTHSEAPTSLVVDFITKSAHYKEIIRFLVEQKHVPVEALTKPGREVIALSSQLENKAMELFLHDLIQALLQRNA